ncbi:MAG TPA: hypothetical protein VNM37_07610 [Candidatus Dormibacteraeota bacterium]|nr:hypothetical protein [Candidatus Dormibacteraeota bacterium]
MADEQQIEEQEPGIQVEVVPESEDEKPRLKGGDTRSLDVRDEEIGKYGKEVQDRIKKLRFAFHEERRQREQKERDFATASDAAQRLYRENLELKKSVTRTEQAVVHQAVARVDAEIERARQQNRAALEAGQADQIVDAGEKLARAVAEKERLNLLQSSGPAEQYDDPPPQQQQARPQPDARTQEWFSRNPWWDKPGEEVRTGFAKGVHEHLARRGITATSHPDLYWKTIDERLAEHFPNANGNGNGHNDREVDQDREDSRSRPLAVAGGTRSVAGAANAGRTRVIRLSESQVRLARKIGITPEQYAQQLAMEQGA